MGWKTFGVQKTVYNICYIYIYSIWNIPFPFPLFVLFRSRPKVQLGAFLGGVGLKKCYGTPLLSLGLVDPNSKKKGASRIWAMKKGPGLFRLYGVKLYCPLLNVLLYPIVGIPNKKQPGFNGNGRIFVRLRKFGSCWRLGMWHRGVGLSWKGLVHPGPG